MVAITMIGVIGGVVALFLALEQLRLQTHELESQTAKDQEAIDIRLAQRALDLMRMLASQARVVVEHPELAPYFQTGKKLPSDKKLRSKVLAHADGYLSLAEATGWQIHVGQMSDEARDAWRAYFTRLYDSTPALKAVVEDNQGLLAQETLELFGLPPASSPE